MPVNMFIKVAFSMGIMRKDERIRAAIAHSGKSPAAVAREIGVSSAAVYQWQSGAVADLRNEHLFALADATGCSARWIGTGEGPMITLYPPQAVQSVLLAMEPMSDDDQDRVARMVKAFAGQEAANHNHPASKRKMDQ